MGNVGGHTWSIVTRAQIGRDALAFLFWSPIGLGSAL